MRSTIGSKFLKSILIVVALICSALVARTQPKIEWQKCLGGSSYDYATCMALTSNGGYVVAGFTFSTDGDVSGLHSGSDPICYRDLWVVKLNPVGIIEWEKSLGGIATEDAFSIIQTSDGGYAIVGISGSLTGDVSGAHGDTLIKHSMSRDSLYTNNYDLWFVKLDSFGSIEW